MNAHLGFRAAAESMKVRKRRAASRALHSFGFVVFAAALAACESAPTCDETMAAVASYPVADQRVFAGSMTKLLPYSNHLTGSDTEFLRATCRDDRWSASYRRCVRAARATVDVDRCNEQHRDENNSVWTGLPHEKAWMNAIADKAAEAMMAAAELARDKQQAAKQVDHSLAELDESIEQAHGHAGQIAELERARGELRARLATARAAAGRAAALAKECENSPLEKPACTTLLAPPAAAP